MKKDYFEDPMLLIIDMQNVYDFGKGRACKKVRKTLANILMLLHEATFSETYLARFIANLNAEDEWFDNSEENDHLYLSNLMDELYRKLRGNIRCVENDVYSAYSKGDITSAVSRSSCVVLAGLISECCVFSTMMSLVEAGKHVIYLCDATSGIDMEKERAVFRALSPHLKIISTREFIAFSNSYRGYDKR